VFPGGNLSLEQDGEIPAIDNNARHQDADVYRIGAMRECFEECGIILAKEASGSKQLIEVNELERGAARRRIHENTLRFTDFIADNNGKLDLEGLVPFTRWITPPNVPKRFTTQMYLYFLPLSSTNAETGLPWDKRALIPEPTSDGGIEHTAAQFLPAKQWLDMALSGEIVLFPPQFFLLHLVQQFLTKPTSDSPALQMQRERIVEFAHSGKPPWTQKCISPIQIARTADGRAILGLDKPGEELNGTTRSGEADKVILVEFGKGGPRRLEVAKRSEALQRQRQESKI
jgi:hypothetical protein